MFVDEILPIQVLPHINEITRESLHDEPIKIVFSVIHFKMMIGFNQATAVYIMMSYISGANLICSLSLGIQIHNCESGMLVG